MIIRVEAPEGVKPSQWMMDRSSRPCRYCPADVTFFYKGGDADDRDSWHIVCEHDPNCPAMVDQEHWAN